MIRIMAWPARNNAAFNPYQKLLYDAVEAGGGVEVVEASLFGVLRGRYDILHLHWPDGFVGGFPPFQARGRLALLRMLVGAAKLHGASIVWTAHNIHSHAARCGPAVETRFWRWWTRSIDGVIYLSEASRTDAIGKHPALAAKPYVITPHGHYRHLDRVAAASSQRARTEPPTVLFFGAISPYKGADDLLALFERQRPDDVRLRIVGQLSRGYELDDPFPQRLRRCGQDRTLPISASLGRKSDAELVAEVQAARLVVLPYRKVLNSGSAIFALSFNTPVLVPDTRAFAELAQIVGSQWVDRFRGELSMEVLRESLARTEGRAVCNLEALDWLAVARHTVGFYRTFG